jgi:PhnB protein
MARDAAPLAAGYHSVNPYFVVADLPSFIAFLVNVFHGVEQREREMRADGTTAHADVLVGDSLVMMSQADAKYAARPAVHFAYVEDVDATYVRALDAGSTSIMAPADQAWGDRVAGIFDPFDNRWWIGTRAPASSPERR